jgi:hypothetical protein
MPKQIAVTPGYGRPDPQSLDGPFSCRRGSFNPGGLEQSASGRHRVLSFRVGPLGSGSQGVGGAKGNLHNPGSGIHPSLQDLDGEAALHHGDFLRTEILEELDEVRAKRCRILADDPDQIKAHTLFEWWPHHN